MTFLYIVLYFGIGAFLAALCPEEPENTIRPSMSMGMALFFGWPVILGMVAFIVGVFILMWPFGAAGEWVKKRLS